MTGREIRKKFLKYFEDRGHTRVSSSSLVPHDDPTLLFTNAGMVQFKNCFMGREDRGCRRAASSQKCVRAGGKHNDLKNVGYTARHHTFFEMLGNFSFGDYFKEEAIAWGWEFLTEVMCIPRDRLWITIYRDDDEAFEIWNKKVGIPAGRIVRMGEKDNFWMMGETGPCGPCSEIIYDQGEGTGCGRPECDLECDCDRHLELWNLVFTQFCRDEAGGLIPLPNPNIDTGMGLERLAAVVQGVKSNYDTDLFHDIIDSIGKISKKRYGSSEENDTSVRVIADHSRAITFLTGDGVLPGNEGRGYVLRRILRRAARHGKLLEIDGPFLHDVVPVVIAVMKEAYPDLVDKESFIRKVVLNEEQRFMETLDTGMKMLNDEMTSLKKAGKNIIPGDVVFKLYDTFGFPVDLTEDIVRKKAFSIDMEGFEKAMEAQRELARKSWKGSGEEAVSDSYKKISMKGISAEFTGYEGVTEATSHITAILKKGEEIDFLKEGEKAEIFAEQTPFYGEKGGQIGDTGVIEGDGFLFEVWETGRPLDNLITHIGKLRKGEIRAGDTAHLKVDEETRRAIEANHSGTHILQAALKKVLGGHVRQSGSLVTPEKLRFDFSHFSRIEDDEIEKIETLANSCVRANLPVSSRMLPMDEAMKTGATAVFDEKYGDNVRVVGMGDFSMELCGGTHVGRTGDIGFLKIIHESAIAAGIRRIEAVTGREALKYVRKTEKDLMKAASLLKTKTGELPERVEKLLKRQKDLEMEINSLKGKMAARDSSDLLSQIREIKGIRVVTKVVEAPDAKTLRDFGDRLRDKIQSGIILIGSRAGNKAMLMCMVTKDLAGTYNAGKIVKEIAPLVGGTGGGGPDMAQAGGSRPENLDQALNKLQEIL